MTPDMDKHWGSEYYVTVAKAALSQYMGWPNWEPEDGAVAQFAAIMRDRIYHPDQYGKCDECSCDRKLVTETNGERLCKECHLHYGGKT